MGVYQNCQKASKQAKAKRCVIKHHRAEAARSLPSFFTAAVANERASQGFFVGLTAVLFREICRADTTKNVDGMARAGRWHPETTSYIGTGGVNALIIHYRCFRG